MAKDEKAAEQPAAEKKSLDIGKLLGFAFIALNIGVIGGGTFVVYQNTLGYHPHEVTEEMERLQLAEEQKYFADNPIVFTMDPFVVNLSGNPQKTIQLEISLEMLSEQGYEEVITKSTEARDMIVKILNGKSQTDLETIQGKLFLKDQITVAINKYLKDGVVKDIYFTSMIVQ
jgi:flagellar basal body-associated protein FliL